MKSLLHNFPMLGICICLPFWPLHYLNSLYVCMCGEAGFYSSWFWSFGHYLGYFLIWGYMSDTVCEIWLRLWLVLASFRECWRQIDQRCKTLVLLRAGFGLCQACLMQPCSYPEYVVLTPTSWRSLSMADTELQPLPPQNTMLTAPLSSDLQPLTCSHLLSFWKSCSMYPQLGSQQVPQRGTAHVSLGSHLCGSLLSTTCLSSPSHFGSPRVQPLVSPALPDRWPLCAHFLFPGTMDQPKSLEKWLQERWRSQGASLPPCIICLHILCGCTLIPINSCCVVFCSAFITVFGGRVISFFVKILFIYSRERVRENKQGKRQAGREGEAISPLSREPNEGFHPRTLGSWPEPMAATRCPLEGLFQYKWH